MAALSRTEINRANVQHSTGPKELEAYQSHLRSFAEEYDPKGATESNLVHALADASWRLNRVVALETNLLTCESENPPGQGRERSERPARHHGDG